MYHHICSNILQFPSKVDLQHALVHHPLMPDPCLQDTRIMDVFASAFAEKKRTPVGIRVNAHLLLSENADIIPAEDRKTILNLFTKALTEIAMQHTSGQLSLPL